MISLPEHLGQRLPIIFRVLVVTVTVYPSVRKFLEYSYRVKQFAAYGIPWPEVTVPLTGLIELVATALIAVGIAGRLGAVLLIVGMIVVGVTAGSNPFSIAVLVSSTGIVALGTGPYSYWDPTITELVRRSNETGESKSIEQNTP